MVRLSDKVTRLATFNATGRLGHEGVEDTLLDLASYSLLALLLYQEEQGAAAAD
jgi:sigma54-dependent transcription regulator